MLTTSPLRYCLGIVAAVVAGAGCVAGDARDFESPRSGRPIIGGTADTSAAHRAVVALTYGPGWTSFCTGTLITPTVVLTAAHCLDGANLTQIEVFFGDVVLGAGDFRAVVEGQVHPQYSGGGALDSDIAILRLGQAAPAGVAPIPHLPATQSLGAADEGSLALEFVGFGVTETQTSGTKLTVGGTLGRACDGPNGCSFGGAWLVPRSIGYANSPGGPCSGDSGGPAFAWRGGQEFLVGVTSYGDPDCAQYGVSTKVDRFQAWIDTFIGSVASEDCDQAGDEDGDGLADCADPECGGHPACQVSDACAQPPLIACGASVTGSTVGGSVAFSRYSCLPEAENGPEVAYELDVAAGTPVTVSLQGTGPGDLDLFLLPASGAGCDPQGCLDASLNPGTTAESVVFTAPSEPAFIVVETWDQAGPFTLSVDCSGGNPTPESCANGVDDDGDGQVDCADSDCAADRACATPAVEICANGVDDDGDGAIDCADAGCTGQPACPVARENCTNGEDDDRDGRIDCSDPDCARAFACTNPEPRDPAAKGGCRCDAGGGTPDLPLVLGLVVGFVAWRRRGRRRISCP